jgi:DNA polymerase-3 subunit gamma/tau
VEAELRRRAAEHPLVKAVLEAFPGATIDAVRDLKVTEESDADPSESNGEDEPAPLPEDDQ